jgi:repressor LexA
VSKELTNIQQQVLTGITKFVGERGYPPTIREIMELFGYASVNNVQRILNVLEKKARIRRHHRGGARCIEVIQTNATDNEKVRRLPVLGKISAGSPLFAEQNIEGYVNIDQALIGSGDFVLRVKGDSMRDANIFNDDLIIIKQTNFPKNNDIVVALLDEEATVKRFVLADNHIRLQPENPNYQPIIIDKNDLYFRVLGKVEAVIHRF